jgi:hypothetical protein
VGALLTGLGIIVLVLLIGKRKEAEAYLSRALPQARTPGKGKNRKK